MILCIIPARGGSKGIPGKNLIPLGGKPLIEWSIEQALCSSLIDQVCVATDSDEIAEVAEGYGYNAQVHRRSERSARDHAPSEEVLCEVLRRPRYRDVELVVFLQATSPIRQPSDIDRAITSLQVENADSLFSARVVQGYTWRDGPGTVNPTYSRRLPRQSEATRVLEENGSIYIFRPEILFTTGLRLGGKIVAYEMSALDSFQIDEPEDVPLIESLLEVRLGHRCTATA